MRTKSKKELKAQLLAIRELADEVLSGIVKPELVHEWVNLIHIMTGIAL